MSDHFQDIYKTKADLYDAMVAREDYEGALLPTLEMFCSFYNADVVEFGAGTGRVTRLLAPLVKSITAFDFMPSMLEVARETLPTQDQNWALAAADNGAMPVKSGVADVTIQGWSFGHAGAWYPDTWQTVIDSYIAEMMRVLKPGGTAILIETMGTGRETPAPPAPHLAEYYQRVEQLHGFQYTWARTDYKFESLDEADQLTRFFFGDALADHVREENWVILPECTGIWWRTKP